VTVEAGRSEASHVGKSHVVYVAVDDVFLVRVTWHTVGRVCTSRDGADDFFPRAVVTGRTGAGTVGGDVMLDGVDCGPVRYSMTFAAQLTLVIRGIRRSNRDSMCSRMGWVDVVEAVGMASETVTRDSEILAGGGTLQVAFSGRVTVRTIKRMCHDICADQGVVVTIRTAGSGQAGSVNSNQQTVIGGIGQGVSGSPGLGVTGLTVTRDSDVLASSSADQITFSDRVTVRAIKCVSFCCCTDQSIVMTIGAAGCPRCDQNTVVWCIGQGVSAAPGLGVTGHTVSTSSDEGLANCRALQVTFCRRMTV